MNIRFIISVFLFAIISCNQSVLLNPNNIKFADKTYYIEYNSEEIKLINKTDSFIFNNCESDIRQLSPCPIHKLIIADIDQDGKEDLCYYYCGFIDIYMNKKLKLSKIKPIILKFKEQHWIDKTPNQNINLENLKGLEEIKDIISLLTD